MMGYIAALEFEEAKTRASIFSTLIFSNVFLTLINRSFTQTIFKTIRMKNWMIPLIIFISVSLLLLILHLPFLNNIFEVVPLTLTELIMPLIIAFASTFWMEVYKQYKNT